MPSKVSWMHDSDNRMLARYQHLHKSTLTVKASQLQKIQRTETREVCISVLLKAVVICNDTLKEMGFEDYETGHEQSLLEKAARTAR
jgi:hypothetical protein